MLGKVEMPSGMGGVNGIVKYTVVDSPGVPPLTPVSLLKQVGAVIDLNSNTMDLKKIETTTTLRTLPSGHVAHKLTEFAPGGWKAPTLEQTDLFQVKTRRVPSRDSAWRDQIEVKQTVCWILKWFCVHSPQSFIFHFRLTINMILTCVLTMPCPLTSSSMINWLKEHPGFECSFASGFDVNAKSAMGNCALVAEVRWRRLALRCLVHVTRASWQIVLDSWQQASSRIAQTECTHLPELLVHRASQWASMDVCDRKRGGCGAIVNYVHSAASIAHKEAKARMKGKKKEVTTISQEPHRLSRVLTPRRKKTLHVQDATANFMSSTPLRDRFYVVVDGLSPEYRVR